MPIVNLNNAVERLDSYLLQDRPLNLEEMSNLRSLLRALLDDLPHLLRAIQTQKIDPQNRLRIMNLTRILGAL